LDTPDFLKLTHKHEDKRFDKLDKLFPKFKDNSWDDNWLIPEERDNEKPSESGMAATAD
jgi:hypothetical protein